MNGRTPCIRISSHVGSTVARTWVIHPVSACVRVPSHWCPVHAIRRKSNMASKCDIRVRPEKTNGGFASGRSQLDVLKYYVLAIGRCGCGEFCRRSNEYVFGHTSGIISWLTTAGCGDHTPGITRFSGRVETRATQAASSRDATATLLLVLLLLQPMLMQSASTLYPICAGRIVWWFVNMHEGRIMQQFVSTQ